MHIIEYTFLFIGLSTSQRTTHAFEGSEIASSGFCATTAGFKGVEIAFVGFSGTTKGFVGAEIVSVGFAALTGVFGSVGIVSIDWTCLLSTVGMFLLEETGGDLVGMFRGSSSSSLSSAKSNIKEHRLISRFSFLHSKYYQIYIIKKKGKEISADC